MRKIVETVLKDGAKLEIHRLVLPDELNSVAVPKWFLPLFKHDAPLCWQLYYDELLAGKTSGIRNYFYAGIVNNIPCCRMWFGFSERTGSGNFGNVLTLPEFRRRGIMREVLNLCVADITKSGALFCSCDAARTAAPAYAAAGFHYIFSPEFCPMVFTRPGEPSFFDIAKKAYGDTTGAHIRPGTLADRFDCDKLLMYTPEVYRKVIPREDIPMYLTLWQEYVRAGKSQVIVLETKSGFCAGYAAWIDGVPYCVLHPDFIDYKEIMLQESKNLR